MVETDNNKCLKPVQDLLCMHVVKKQSGTEPTSNLDTFWHGAASLRSSLVLQQTGIQLPSHGWRNCMGLVLQRHIFGKRQQTKNVLCHFTFDGWAVELVVTKKTNPSRYRLFYKNDVPQYIFSYSI